MSDTNEEQKYEAVGPNTELPGSNESDTGNEHPKTNQDTIRDAINYAYQELNRLYAEQSKAYDNLCDIQTRLIENHGKISGCSEYLKMLTTDSTTEQAKLIVAQLFVAAQEDPKLWRLIYGNEP